jgi:5-methylcytosine-specific restriction endonuclease McrA
MPALTPYEATLYIFLLRNSFIKNGSCDIRIGKRTIGGNLGSSRGQSTAFSHVTELLKGLKEKGCIKIGDTNREGTLYSISLPEDIPLVKEKLVVTAEQKEEDFFNDPEKRKEVFERDKWLCHYCGDEVTDKNATLDHLIPQCKGGGHNKNNLKTCCLVCNAIKSGKTYEEAAPFLKKYSGEKTKVNLAKIDEAASTFADSRFHK